ncbi:hypothetical protein HY490_00160 [Candidatus Woesearchaeota archaeon]|nr:hypothetical protein [Candidatus Woesearchaeota archaeon]
MTDPLILSVSAASIATILGLLLYIKYFQNKLRKHIFRNDEYLEYFKKL